MKVNLMLNTPSSWAFDTIYTDAATAEEVLENLITAQQKLESIRKYAEAIGDEGATILAILNK